MISQILQLIRLNFLHSNCPVLEVKLAFSGTTAKLGVVFKCHSPVHPYQYRYYMIFIDYFAQDFPKNIPFIDDFAQGFP